MSRLEDIIARINAAGFRVNNLNQSDEDWGAKLRSKDRVYSAMGVADTPAEALEIAFDRIKVLAAPPEDLFS